MQILSHDILIIGGGLSGIRVAILAKNYRFLADSRDRRNEEILRDLNNQQGVWGSKTVFNCVNAYPKQVPPTHAIVKMRRKILSHGACSLVSSFLRQLRS
jgi:succinate dehydrogenase/fumarate reductase-like Fe-S protein